MDDLKLPSTVLLTWDLKRCIEKNLSLQLGIERFVKRMTNCQSLQDSFAKNFIKWWNSRQMLQTSSMDHFNAQHRAIVNLIEMGLRGQAIYESLKSMELDLIEICESDIQEHSAKLPLFLQIPLIFLVFPAICILLLVPTLAQLMM